jgi:diguanylate cyclase (GGDEF)-like protein
MQNDVEKQNHCMPDTLKKTVEELEQELADKNKLIHVLMEASPVSYTIYDKDLRVIECSDKLSQIFNCPDKQYIMDSFWETFSPVYQPDGRKSSEKAFAMRDDAFTYGKTVFEWDHKTLDGETIPVENTLSPIMYNSEKCLISYKYDLRNIKKMEENIRWLESEVEKVFYDPLTGIYNRRYFDENLSRLIKVLSRSEGTLSLMMIDIDFFKLYNDTYGHSEGDNCLKIVAKTLSKAIIRSDDFVARYGGEEFAAVLPNTDEKGARLIAGKLLEKIRNCKVQHEKSSVAGYVTISIGITTGTVNHKQSAEDYIKRADEMLYASKQSGRNKYSFATL